MIALDMIAALGGLCGAAALFLHIQEMRSFRADRLERLAADLAAWEGFSSEERASAAADMADYDADRDVEREPYGVLLDIKFVSEALERPQPQSIAGAFARRFLEAAASSGPRSEAVLLQAAAQALRGPRHG